MASELPTALSDYARQTVPGSRIRRVSPGWICRPVTRRIDRSKPEDGEGTQGLPSGRGQDEFRIALLLMGELLAALRANDSDAFRGLLSEGIQELGVTEVEELLLDWLY